MCGFVVTNCGNTISASRFSDALDLIRHRGPDETKVVMSNNYQFGFQRLAIQDLTPAGSQPMIDRNGNILCFNGEIYNFLEIRNELKSVGEVFISQCDTEVLLKAVSVFGFARTLKKLDGMYAGCYFDYKQSKLFLFRDPFGMKPLFYHLKEGKFVCASEVKAILPLMDSVEIDQVSSYNPLFFSGMPPVGNTMFKGVSSVKPGHYLEIGADGQSQLDNCFCDLVDFVNEKEFTENKRLPRKVLTEKFAEVFEDSVKSHLISDAPLSILFSAGLDSSMVAAVARKYQSKGQELFKYQSDNLDDSFLAKQFANKFDCKLHVTAGIDKSLILKLPHLIYSYETLNKADGAPLSQVCESARKNGFKVMLTGDSSDELWGGYKSFLSFRLNQVLKAKAPRVPGSRIFSSLLPGLSYAGIESLHHMVSPFDVKFMKPFLDFGLFGFQREEGWQKCRKAYEFLGDEYNQNVNAFLLDEARSRLERIMLRADRVGMANSVELRLPFLSKNMFRLASNVPFQRKSRFAPSAKRRTLFWDKAPLRDMAKGAGVSGGIINRPKIGTPIGEVDFQNLKKINASFEFVSCQRLFGIGATQINKYISALEFFPLANRLLWTFLSMEIFLRIFVEKQSPFEIEQELAYIIHRN